MRGLLIALILTASPIALAEMDHAMHGLDMNHAQAPANLADGTVKKVDQALGKLTLQHGPLENLGMPAMTMVFRVKDAAWLGQVKAGDRIRFAAEKLNGAYTVTQIEKAD